MEGRKHLTDWLRDAHGMEKQSITLLEKQADRLKSYPEMEARIRQHIQESQRQVQRLEECINRLNGGTSTTKDVMGKVMGNVGAMFNAGASDEVVKNAIGNFAVESFEIASYMSLVAAAEAVGDDYTAGVCREILREEQEMAEWVGRNIGELTRAFLTREAAGVESKR